MIPYANLVYSSVSKKPIPQRILDEWEKEPYPGGRKDSKGKAPDTLKTSDEELMQGPSNKHKRVKKGMSAALY